MKFKKATPVLALLFSMAVFQEEVEKFVSNNEIINGVPTHTDFVLFNWRHQYVDFDLFKKDSYLYEGDTLLQKCDTLKVNINHPDL